MHLGMTGWIHIKGERTAYTNYYKKMKEGDLEQWPPRFWKWQITTDSKPVVEVAFTDPRRLGRVRLVDCPGADIRKNPPLSVNGPDPVVDAKIFTANFLKQKMKARKVPVKALLLDQTVISGIGNWVADEVLFQSRTHPEQYCNDFSDEHMQRVYEAIRMVCQTACDKLGNSDEFPDDWLFNHRWGKGKSGGKLPNGEKLAFLTVGGRTSCYAPALQKKTGSVPKESEVKEEEMEQEEVEAAEKKKPLASKKRKSAAADEDSDAEEASPAPKAKARGARGKAVAAAVAPQVNKRARAAKKEGTTTPVDSEVNDGRRRSTRKR
jgi:formamidopyrimidine-DNA glycosylase